MYTHEQVAQIKSRTDQMLADCFDPWIESETIAFSDPAIKAVAIEVEIYPGNTEGHHDCGRDDGVEPLRMSFRLGDNPQSDPAYSYESLQQEGAETGQADWCTDDHFWVWVAGLHDSKAEWLAYVILLFIMMEFNQLKVPAVLPGG